MRAWLLIGVFFTMLTANAETVHVDSIASLQSAINKAKAGDRIILADGVYTTDDFIMVTSKGTAENRIIIEAESILGVEITGTSGFYVDSSAAYITIKGFHFTHSTYRNTNGTNKIKKAKHIRFTCNFFNNTGDGDLLTTTGPDTEIDHNEFSFQNPNEGEHMLYVWGPIPRVWIHHNYFRDQSPRGGNGFEVIKYGTGVSSWRVSNGLVEHNLIERTYGETETISNKATGNTYRYNTLNGAKTFTLRAGDDVKVYGNYFKNLEIAIRVFGARHKIFANYFEGNKRGVDIGNFRENAYAAADHAVVAHNTFINNHDVHILRNVVGTLPATNVTIANNLIQGGGTSGWIAKELPNPDGIWEGNISWNTSDLGNMPAESTTIVDPKLAQDAQGVYRIQAGSPAIDAGLGSYPDVNVDMDGQLRYGGVSDVGADEYSSAPIIAKLLTPADVGPFAGTSNPPPTNLKASPGDGFVTLNWDDSPEPAFMHFNIYRSATSAGGYTLIFSGALTSDYVDNDVTNGATYYYAVTSVDNSDNESSYSRQVSATPTGTNLALNGTASQSSTDFGGVASRAIDGKTSGAYTGNSVTHTMTESQPWWQLDLGDSFHIDEIQIWGRTDESSKARLSDYNVFILNQAGQQIWSNYQAEYPDPMVSLAPSGATGRYLKVQLKGSNALSLAEVRVYGEEAIGLDKDEVTDISGPTMLIAGSTVDLSFDYVASETRDLLLRLQNEDNGHKAEANKRITVQAGSASLTESMVIDSDAPTGVNYQWQVILTTVDGGWDEKLAVRYQKGVTVEAAASNTAPVFNRPTIITTDATVGVTYSASIAGEASDVDGDTLAYSRVSGPAWLSVSSSGSLAGMPTSAASPATFLVKVVDGQGGEATATLAITVTDPDAGGNPGNGNDIDSGSSGGSTGVMLLSGLILLLMARRRLAKKTVPSWLCY